MGKIGDAVITRHSPKVAWAWTANRRFEASVSGAEAPVSRAEAPVSRAEAPVSRAEARASRAEAPVSDAEASEWSARGRCRGRRTRGEKPCGVAAA